MHRGNEVVLHYMKTGKLSWRPLGPFGAVEYQNPGGPPPTDYIGINYYSRHGLDCTEGCMCGAGQLCQRMLLAFG